MKPLKAITDPEAFKLLGDETRRQMMFLLRAKEMTVTQIAAELNLTPQAVYHHIKKLTDAEMVEVVREKRVAHLIESYYRATAESFICSVGRTPSGIKAAKEQVIAALYALKKLGFKIEFDDKKISSLVDLQVELEQCCGVEEFEDKIAELDDVDFLTKQEVSEYASIISMSDEEFARQIRIKKRFRDLLISLVKK